MLKNKTAIITGSTSGIGYGIAQTIAKEGAIAVIIGRKIADNQKAIDQIEALGGKAFGIEAELTKPEACENAVKKAIAQFGKIDGLVNNAGLNDGVGLENGNYEGFVQSLHNNLIHYYLMAHHALPELIKSKGNIVNISSKTGETGQGNTSAYAASNGGIPPFDAA